MVYAGNGKGDQSAGERSVPDEGRSHVPVGTPLQYRSNPPASGSHYPTPSQYGVYQQPVAPGYWVHNLEHGSIVVLYRCREGSPSCSRLVEQLRTLYQQAPPGKYGQVKMVVTPYPQLRTPVAAVAWDRILELRTFDRDRLLGFYRAHVDKGPEDVP